MGRLREQGATGSAGKQARTSPPRPARRPFAFPAGIPPPGARDAAGRTPRLPRVRDGARCPGASSWSPIWAWTAAIRPKSPGSEGRRRVVRLARDRPALPGPGTPDTVLHDPKTQRVEAAWRGLNLLASHAAEGLLLEALSVPRAQLVARFRERSTARARVRRAAAHAGRARLRLHAQGVRRRGPRRARRDGRRPAGVRRRARAAGILDLRFLVRAAAIRGDREQTRRLRARRLRRAAEVGRRALAVAHAQPLPAARTVRGRNAPSRTPTPISGAVAAGSWAQRSRATSRRTATRSTSRVVAAGSRTWPRAATR